MLGEGRRTMTEAIIIFFGILEFMRLLKAADIILMLLLLGTDPLYLFVWAYDMIVRG